MKKILILALLAFACATTIAKAETSKLNQIKLIDPNDVSIRANKEVNYGSAGVSPINPMMGGMYNMVQGTNANSYALQEIQKQQNDYAKQQLNQVSE